MATQTAEQPKLKRKEPTAAAESTTAEEAALSVYGGTAQQPPSSGFLAVSDAKPSRSNWDPRWRTACWRSGQTIPNKYHSNLGGALWPERASCADGKRRNHGPRWCQAPALCWRRAYAALCARWLRIPAWRSATLPPPSAESARLMTEQHKWTTTASTWCGESRQAARPTARPGRPRRGSSLQGRPARAPTRLRQWCPHH